MDIIIRFNDYTMQSCYIDQDCFVALIKSEMVVDIIDAKTGELLYYRSSEEAL